MQSNYHHSQVHSDTEIESSRVPSMGQIELFNLLLGIINKIK